MSQTDNLRFAGTMFHHQQGVGSGTPAHTHCHSAACKTFAPGLPMPVTITSLKTACGSQHSENRIRQTGQATDRACRAAIAPPATPAKHPATPAHRQVIRSSTYSWCNPLENNHHCNLTGSKHVIWFQCLSPCSMIALHCVGQPSGGICISWRFIGIQWN